MSPTSITSKRVSDRLWGVCGAVIGLAVVAWYSGMARELSRPVPFAERVSNRLSREFSPSGNNVGRDDRFDRVFALAEESRRALAGIKDYTAVFSKTELVHERLIEQTMRLKLRENPFSVYLRCQDGRKRGREVLYVAGANDGKLLVHEGGLKSLAGTLSIDPGGIEVMGENWHPVTDLGMSQLLNKSLQTWQNDVQHGPEESTVEIIDDGWFDSREVIEVRVTRHRRISGCEFRISSTYFDKDSKLPAGAVCYGWEDQAGSELPLLERYLYSDIEVNVGLTSEDFSEANRDYGF